MVSRQPYAVAVVVHAARKQKWVNRHEGAIRAMPTKRLLAMRATREAATPRALLLKRSPNKKCLAFQVEAGCYRSYGAKTAKSNLRAMPLR